MFSKREFVDQDWPHDWIGEWYPTFRALGEVEDVIFVKCSSTGQKLKEHLIDHAQYDGPGALWDLTQKENTPAYSSRKNEIRPAGFFAHLIQILIYLWDTRVRHTPWQMYHHQIPGKKMIPQIIVLNPEQTHNLVLKSKMHKVSLTSYLLKMIDEKVREYLGPNADQPARKNYWLIPVDMRAEIRRKNPLGNHYSYITLKVTAQTTISEIHRQLIKRLSGGYYKAAWWGLTIGRFVGIAGMQKITRRYFHRQNCWAGVFSNMGVWGNPDSKDIWSVCSPVTRAHPVGVVCLTWNGHLTLSVQVHPCVDLKGELSPKLFLALETALRQAGSVGEVNG